MKKITELQRLSETGQEPVAARMSTVSISFCGRKGHSIWSLTSYFLC
ncbi:hypothetical protein [Secundilactobacillus paracollinoides]|nr:hypothetical protein [Secundilactobacillus paracollinoides]